MRTAIIRHEIMIKRESNQNIFCDISISTDHNLTRQLGLTWHLIWRKILENIGMHFLSISAVLSVKLLQGMQSRLKVTEVNPLMKQLPVS